MTARALSRGLAALATLAVAALAQAVAAAPAASSPASPPAARPLRIVTLLPSLTETVCALGDCDRLVGVDRYSDWPERVRTLPALGGQDDAQVERIVALHPDLVLASPSTRAVGRLRSLGLRVVTLEAHDTLETRRVLEAVARALARPGEGEALWRRLDARIEAAASRVPAAWRGRRAYVEVGSEPYAAGRASFVGDLLARLGLDNIVPPALGAFPKLNPEFIVRAQPDLVIAEARDAAAMSARPGWAALQALQRHAVCGFASTAWEALIRPGPRLADAAEQVADCVAALPPPAPAPAAQRASR
jgi:iron complex transport system substrate-binding protein